MVIGDGNGDNTLNIEVFAHHGNMVCSINSLIDKNNETLLATWGNIKWKNENFDHCFDDVGDKVDRLLSDFLQQNVEQEGGRNAAWWF